MIKNEIELKALNSFGIAKAYVAENFVSIKVYGISGCLKAWLTGKNNIEIGNLVDGSIKKSIDTSSYSGILLTQSGRQMFYGKFRSDADTDDISSPEKAHEPIFDFNDGYNWQIITSKKYPSENLSVRYILSHKCFYDSFMLHGRYFYGTKAGKCAVAIECNIKNEPHPFLNLSAYSVYKDGYMIVCTDTEHKTFCTYE